VGEVVEVVNPASAAFVERLQSSSSFARKCLIAAQQRQKAFADKNCVEKTLKVDDKVLLSTKYLSLKHSKGLARFSSNGLVHLKSCMGGWTCSV
jgi:hypothetical protein